MVNPNPKRAEFLRDVLTTIEETSAVTYWARAGSRSGTFQERETGRAFPLTVGMVARGLRKMRDPAFDVHAELRGRILCAEVVCDGGMIDCEAADVICQAACLGELVYG